MTDERCPGAEEIDNLEDQPRVDVEPYEIEHSHQSRGEQPT